MTDTVIVKEHFINLVKAFVKSHHRMTNKWAASDDVVKHRLWQDVNVARQAVYLWLDGHELWIHEGDKDMTNKLTPPDGWPLNNNRCPCCLDDANDKIIATSVRHEWRDYITAACNSVPGLQEEVTELKAQREAVIA